MARVFLCALLVAAAARADDNEHVLFKAQAIARADDNFIQSTTRRDDDEHVLFKAHVSQRGASSAPGSGSAALFRESPCSQLSRANASNAVHLRPSKFRGTPGCNESAALHSYGTDAHCRSVLREPMTGYFLIQQEAERRFLDKAEAELCAPGLSQQVYHRRLDALFAPLRKATHAHIHGAFLVKSACTINTNLDYHRADFALLSTAGKHMVQETDWCPQAVLHHEPHNVAESWHVWNISSALIRAGAGFCAQPAIARAKLFRSWRNRLGVVTAFHRSNNAFSMYTDRYEAACAASPHYAKVAGLIQGDYRQTMRQLTNMIEASRDGCSVAGVTAGDLISGFGNDTRLTIAVARAMLDSHQPCARARTDGTLAPGLGDVLASDLPGMQRALQRLRESPTFSIYMPAGSGHWVAWAMTLATVYHVLVPMCSPADPLMAPVALQTDWACREQGGDPEGQIVYELLPSCTASASEDAAARVRACQRATGALDRYRAYLHRFSPVRAKLVLAMARGSCPFAGDGADDLAARIRELSVDLGSVLDGLRRNERALVASCVVPSRHDAAPPACLLNFWKASGCDINDDVCVCRSWNARAKSGEIDLSSCGDDDERSSIAEFIHGKCVDTHKGRPASTRAKGGGFHTGRGRGPCFRVQKGGQAGAPGTLTPDGAGAESRPIERGDVAWADGTFCPAPPPGAAAPAAAGSSGGGLTLEQAAQIAWPSDSP